MVMDSPVREASPCALTPYTFHLWDNGLLCTPEKTIIAVIRRDWSAKLPEECICRECADQALHLERLGANK
jgi:hypothetical protein